MGFSPGRCASVVHVRTFPVFILTSLLPHCCRAVPTAWYQALEFAVYFPVHLSLYLLKPEWPSSSSSWAQCRSASIQPVLFKPTEGEPMRRDLPLLKDPLLRCVKWINSEGASEGRETAALHMCRKPLHRPTGTLKLSAVHEPASSRPAHAHVCTAWASHVKAL